MSDQKGHFLTKDKVLEVTNGGLDIIVDYFPDAQDVADKKKTHFKMHEERTASASLKEYNGVWMCTDFGDEQRAKDCFEIVKMKEGLEDFKEVIRFIGEKYRIAPDGTIKASKPEFVKEEAAPEEEEKSYQFDVKEEPSDADFREIFPHYHPSQKDKFKATLDKYYVKALNSFTYIKNRKRLITKSTETYPIFLIEGEGFRKIYQPRSDDKQYRFRYTGEKPKNYVFGLKQLREMYNRLNEEKKADEASGEEGMGFVKEVKVPEVIICSGDRDSLNVASLGYTVIWLNSETAELDQKLVRDLFKFAENVYNLPDIDNTGVRQGTEVALKNLDIATIWLPEKLKKRKDFRGNFCKDVTDFFRYLYRRRQDFSDLLKISVPARLYDVIPQEKGFKYQFNNVQCYEFLRLNGFYRLESQNEKSGYIFIHIQGNIVEEVKPEKIRDFVNDFLKENKENIHVRNAFYRTNQLSESSLSNLPMIEIDFTDFDKHNQLLFFENVTWEVTKDGITEHKPGSLDRYVWREEVIPHKVNKMDDFFTVKYDPDLDQFDLKVKNKDCLFFQYLDKASKVHWRKELEEAEPLSEDEEYEQQLHLINKMYCLGYLLHRYKDPSRPWCVYAMDHKISEQGESHGGSGKSIFCKAPVEFMKTVTLDGRNPKLTDNPHIYERVTVHTDYILIDDANQYLKFNFFFAPLTGNLTVNPKNNKQYEIPFQQVPKFAISSNYTLREIDPSTERRILYTVFSDYYHYNSNGEYRESRSPKDDFGKNLLLDFNDEEWNLFFNFVAQCVKLYLNHDKIDPPMDNVQRRNLMTLMTEHFKAWADVYFIDKENLNQEVVKKVAFESFREETKLKNWTANRFKKSLGFWCSFHGFILNPKYMCNDRDRIIKKIDGVVEEMVYIDNKEKPLPEPKDSDLAGF